MSKAFQSEDNEETETKKEAEEILENLTDEAIEELCKNPDVTLIQCFTNEELTDEVEEEFIILFEKEYDVELE
ncbi:hypothetical protein [Methanobrevibacter sp. UBA46]|jgi:hypothetical protein|uniref:hypothetical protein n=1 Tax=Methanobrevibacter sp. UBA46 TaxID=1915488 RepID=UPI0039B86429